MKISCITASVRTPHDLQGYILIWIYAQNRIHGSLTLEGILSTLDIYRVFKQQPVCGTSNRLPDGPRGTGEAIR